MFWEEVKWKENIKSQKKIVIVVTKLFIPLPLTLRGPVINNFLLPYRNKLVFDAAIHNPQSNICKQC